MIRREILELASLGRFETEQQVDPEILKRRQELLAAVRAPISDLEAMQLVKLFGVDDHFGIAWTMLHLIESAPSWPLESCFADSSNEWVIRLRESAKRGRLGR